MTSAKWRALRLRSEGCSTCEDLRRLEARIADAQRSALDRYRAALNATDYAALQNLGEESKQISAAHKLVCYAVDAHLTSRHSQANGVRWAA
jgi:hypothetical protein